MSREIGDLNLPDDVRYTEDHEWAKPEGENYRVGVSDYAQDQLGEIVFVELPDIGSEFDRGDEFGTLESVKAVAELYMPVGGEIVAVNDDLGDAPELVNGDPNGKGWLIDIKPSDPAEYGELKTRDAYVKMLKGV